MIGLMLKDLLSLRKASGRILIIMAVYTVIFATAGNVSFLSAMIILILTMFIMNTFSYDETSKWDYYALSLPVTKSGIVLSKYLLTLLFDLIGILISLVIFLIRGELKLETTLGICALSVTAIIMAAILLPIIYKAGTQKARIWMILIYLIPFAGLMALNSLHVLPTLKNLDQISSTMVETAVFLMIPVSLLLFVLSYLLSCHIFKRKSI